MAQISITSLIKPFSKRPIASPDQKIGQVLEYADSSHQPIYVIQDNKYLGVVSAYQSLYHNFHAPHTKKVVSELLHTPHLTESSSLFEVIRAMMDTRLYELPIVDKNNNVSGIITVDDILQTVLNDKMISAYLLEKLKPHTAIFRPHSGTVEDVFHLLREKGISRVILTDKLGKVNGIVTRSDIQTAFLRPTARQRFTGVTETQNSQFFDQEPIYRDDDPIERYSNTNVYTIAEDTPMRDILKDLMKSEYKSVVLTDKQGKPSGFLSTRDILHCLATFEPDTDIPVSFQRPDNTVSDEQINKAQEKVFHTIKKLSKMRDIMKVEVAVDQQKYSNEKTSLFKTNIHLDIPGNNIIATAEAKLYLESVQNALAQAEKQFIKQTKHSHHKSSPSASA